MEKITKAQERELKKLAEALPPTTYTAYHGKATGAEILKENPLAVEPGGKPIRPNQLYKRPVALPVNHFNRLKAAWKQGGAEAAKKYLDKVLPPEPVAPVENEK